MPPDYVRDLLPTEIVGAVLIVAAIAWGVRMVTPAVRRLWAVGKAIEDLVESWRGTPEVRDASGQVIEEAHPGVPARLARIEHEVTPNHGTSAHDKLAGKVDHLTGLVSEALSEIGDSRREARDRDEAHSGRLYRVEQLTARLAEELAQRTRHPEGE